MPGRTSTYQRGRMHNAVAFVDGRFTTLGVFAFEPTSRRMQLLALHPGATVEQVRENTGFEVLVSPQLTTTKPPTEEELSILRMLDPKRQFIG